MATFYVWARPVDLFPPVDHTWVTTYNPVATCPPDPKKGAFWYCWGGCYTTNDGDEAALICQGSGDLKRATKQSTPNDAGDHAGLTGFYGQHGVCHQVTNRILAAGKTGMEVRKKVRGWFISYFLYGPYGSDGTFSP